MKKNDISVCCVFTEEGESFTDLIKQSFQAFLLGKLENDQEFAV